MPWLYPGRSNAFDNIAVLLMLVMPLLGYLWERRKPGARLRNGLAGAVAGGLGGAVLSITIGVFAGRVQGLPHPLRDALDMYVRYVMFGLSIGFAGALGHYMSRNPMAASLVSAVALFSTVQYFELAHAVQRAQAEQPHDGDAAGVVIPSLDPGADFSTTRITGKVYQARPNGGPTTMPVAVGAHAFLYNPQNGLTTGVTTDSTGQFYFDVDEQMHREGEVLVCVRGGVPIGTRAEKMGGAPVLFQPGVLRKRSTILEDMTRLAHMTGWSQPLPPDCVADMNAVGSTDANASSRAAPSDDPQGRRLMMLAPAPQPRAGLRAFLRAWLARPQRVDSFTYAAPADREVFVRLPDETIVQLEPGAAVRFARGMTTRRERGARLQGVARLVFEPAAGAPLRLWTPAMQITLDSTSTIVVVRALPDSTDVVAEQGRVWLDLLDPAGAVTGVRAMVEHGAARARTAREWAQSRDPISRMELEMKRVRIPKDQVQLPALPMMYGGPMTPPAGSSVAERAQGGDVSLSGAPSMRGERSSERPSPPRKDAVSDSALGDSISVLRLPDHSLAQLAPGAVVTHAPDMTIAMHRSVVLQGTARFVAGKAPQRFYVFTPAVRIRFDAAITQAIVRSTPEATDIVVEFGQVYMDLLDPDGNATNVSPFVHDGFHIRVRTAREFHDSRDPKENADREAERISVPSDPPTMPRLQVRP